MGCDRDNGNGTIAKSLWARGMVAIFSPWVLWFSSPLVGGN